MYPTTLDGFCDGKTAMWRFSASAMLLDRLAHKLAEQRLGQLAYLRMVRDQCCQRAALPPNPEGILRFLQLCQPSQGVQGFGGDAQAHPWIACWDRPGYCQVA